MLVTNPNQSSSHLVILNPNTYPERDRNPKRKTDPDPILNPESNPNPNPKVDAEYFSNTNTYPEAMWW